MCYIDFNRFAPMYPEQYWTPQPQYPWYPDTSPKFPDTFPVMPIRDYRDDRIKELEAEVERLRRTIGKARNILGEPRFPYRPYALVSIS